MIHHDTPVESPLLSPMMGLSVGTTVFGVILAAVDAPMVSITGIIVTIGGIALTLYRAYLEGQRYPDKIAEAARDRDREKARADRAESELAESKKRIRVWNRRESIIREQNALLRGLLAEQIKDGPRGAFLKDFVNLPGVGAIDADDRDNGLYPSDLAP